MGVKDLRKFGPDALEVSFGRQNGRKGRSKGRAGPMQITRSCEPALEQIVAYC